MPQTDIVNAAIAELLVRPTFELIPMKGVDEQIHHLAPSSRVTVTASPARTMEDTLDLAAALRWHGHEVIPHVAAHMVESHTHLAALIDRMADLSIRGVFVIGGDAEIRGEFPDAGSLLDAMEGIGHPFDDIGIGGYPEGNPNFDDGVGLAALLDKQRHASWITTQMCFDATAIVDWLGRIRTDGIRLPVHLGVAGTVSLTRLARIAGRIGVGASLRFLSKHRGLATTLAGTLTGPGGYQPDELLEQLDIALADTVLDIARLHIFTFNQVEQSERWRQEQLALRS